MIFRRIKAHIAKENWFSVVIDFLIVLVGILLAFQITEWGGRQAEKRSLNVALERLHEEIKLNVAAIDNNAQRHENIFLAGVDLLKLIRTQDIESIPIDLIGKVFVDGFTTDYSTSALTSVLNQQTFQGLQSSELRPTISSLPAEYLDAREDELTVIQRLDEHWLPYISQKLPVGPLWAVAYKNSEWESYFASLEGLQYYDPVSVDEFKVLAASMPFQNEIVNRITYEKLIMIEQKELRIILVQALKLIEEEIEEHVIKNNLKTRHRPKLVCSPIKPRSHAPHGNE